MKQLRIAVVLFVLSCLGVTSAFGTGSIKQTNLKSVLSIGEQMSSLIDMLEIYSLIGLGVTYDTPVKKLKNSITAYDMMLINLSSTYRDETMQKSIEKTRLSWRKIRRALYGVLVLTDRRTMKLNAVYINEKLRIAIRELNEMKDYLLKSSGIKNKNILDAAILMGVSSKRLSSNYMMKVWGVEDPSIDKYWKKNMETFSRSLEYLKESSFTKDKEFGKYLKTSLREFRYFSVVYTLQHKVPALVNRKAAIVTHSADNMIKTILLKQDTL